MAPLSKPSRVRLIRHQVYPAGLPRIFPAQRRRDEWRDWITIFVLSNDGLEIIPNTAVTYSPNRPKHKSELCGINIRPVCPASRWLKPTAAKEQFDFGILWRVSTTASATHAASQQLLCRMRKRFLHVQKQHLHKSALSAWQS